MSGNLSLIQRRHADQMPANFPMKAGQGFVVTTALSLLLGKAVSVALLGGSLAVLASGIESVTRPIIRSIFPNHPAIAVCIQLIVPTMLALSLAQVAVPWIGVAYHINHFILSCVAWIVLNENFYSNNQAMAVIL